MPALSSSKRPSHRQAETEPIETENSDVSVSGAQRLRQPWDQRKHGKDEYHGGEDERLATFHFQSAILVLRQE